MIKIRRTQGPRPAGNRVDPAAVREPVKVKAPCLACASRSRVAQHTCR